MTSSMSSNHKIIMGDSLSGWLGSDPAIWAGFLKLICIVNKHAKLSKLTGSFFVRTCGSVMMTDGCHHWIHSLRRLLYSRLPNKVFFAML
jgi:hypothetical protein